jgi:translation initiation factor 6
MGIYKYNIYRTPNIGIFLKTNDKLLLVPKGLAHTKVNNLVSLLNVKHLAISIANTRLLGPLIAMNNNSILVPRIIEDVELDDLKSTGLDAIILNTLETSLGNLIVMNDRCAIISTKLSKDIANEIKDRLSIEVVQMQFGDYYQVGSMIVATNKGAAVHPIVNDKDVEFLASILHVHVEPATVNNGIPFIASGVVANSNNVIVGSLTTGPELVMLSRAFSV